MNYLQAAKNWSHVSSRVVYYGLPALVVGPFASRVPQARRASQKLMHLWFKDCCDGTGLNRSLVDGHKLDQVPQCIFVSNHVSLIDTLVIGSLLDRDYRWVAKEGVFQVPILGWHLRFAGHIPAYRNDPSRNRSLPVLIHNAVNEGASVLFYAEGGRSRDGELRPFKIGAFRAAIAENLPIVPLVIRGTREILKPGELDLAMDRTKSCTVKVLDAIPLPTGGDERSRAERLRDLTRETISADLNL